MSINFTRLDPKKLSSWISEVREGPGFFCTSLPGPWLQHYFKDNSELQTLINKYKDVNSIYVSMGCFTDKNEGRIKSKAGQFRSFWLDLDSHGGGKYSTPGDALDDLLMFISETHLPSPTYIHQTGNGIHAFWVTDDSIETTEWLAISKDIRRIAEEYGLDIDGEVTTDAARVLRIPFTKNFRNPSNPIDTFLIGVSNE